MENISQVSIASQTTVHQFWLANIQPCIIGFDPLAKWEAMEDVFKPMLHLRAEAMLCHVYAKKGQKSM